MKHNPEDYPRLVLYPDELCFKCNGEFDVLEYYICGNGEYTGYCQSCLREMQGDRYCE